VCACSAAGERRHSKNSQDSAVVTELNTDSDSLRKPTTTTEESASRDSGSSSRIETLDAAPPATARQADTLGMTFQSNFRCGVRNTPVLTTLGVGNLQIGRTIAIVKQTCRVLRDLQEDNEGNPERIVTVVIGNEPVRVTVVNGLVWRIALASPTFATRSGLRVGTPLARLVQRRGVHLLEGEDGLYVTLDSLCGLSFRFSIPSRETPGKPWTVSHVVQRHGAETVNRILVSRCSS
jgi:hypothetical protein